MNMFDAIYTPEAKEQYKNLQLKEQAKILKTITIFEALGIQARVSKHLIDELFEIKADNIRAYFKYHNRKIIIVGLIVLKKTQKAPKKYIEQAIKNIEKFIAENKELQDD